ncbi:MAG: hypothetical protein IJC46_01135 [Clostridia bacterium]|nr:hypothetical protein [Clostridia bacterium]
MDYIFKDVLERDMDLLILREFAENQQFAKWFISKTGQKAEVFCVAKIAHSLTDADLGESDMTVVLKTSKGKVGLLIEDKIDADAMPQQALRYMQRGEKGKRSGDYDDYFVFIIAPRKYLEYNEEAKKYPYQLAYEEILDYIKEDENSGFKQQLLRRAIDKQKAGYQVHENAAVTLFWERYSRFQKEHFPDLRMSGALGPKGSSATWVTFSTDYKKLYIDHKSEKGFVDLTFEGRAKRFEEFRLLMEGLLEVDMFPVTIGKSIAVRINVPVVEFKEAFDEQCKAVEKCLAAIHRLFMLSRQIDGFGLLSLYKDE